MQTNMTLMKSLPRRREEQQSLLSYSAQGAASMGFLLFLFWMAGLQF
ncbi:hypothetical protein ACI6QG_13310 [Roseococcus sp. DSY-14]